MGRLRTIGQENSLSALGSRNSRQCVCGGRGYQQHWPQAVKILTVPVSLGGHTIEELMSFHPGHISPVKLTEHTGVDRA